MSSEDRFWVPIDPGDLRELAAMLSAQDVFTASFEATADELYDPCTYLLQSERFEVETRYLVDRNILTRWLAVSRAEAVRSEHRVAAAAFAFAQCSGIQIEPNISLYEFARTQGAAAAQEDLLLFRRADIVHPGYWAEVALARSDTVPLPEAQPLGPNDFIVDFEMGLRRWRRNYILALKIAELELEGGSAEARIRRLLHWMYDDFLLGGPALVLAALYLAPGSRRQRLFKSLRSGDRDKALLGIRNAAWDITLVSAFLLATQEQDNARQLNVLVSLDPRMEASLLVKLWGERAGRDLAGEIARMYANANAPHRQLNRTAPTNFIDDLIEKGEKVIVDWRPKGGA